MRRRPFIKMHGAGNDYVYLDCFTHPVPQHPEHLARRVSNRNFGIGSDGLVLMLPPDPAADELEATARMRMFNADGSEGSLCGNALRCMAMWLHQTGRCGRTCRILMGPRVIDAGILQSDSQAGTAQVRMEVGNPGILNPPADGLHRYVRTAMLAGVRLPGLMSPPQEVSMGNPHLVLFARSLGDCNVHDTGQRLEHHVEFPHRTNVEFVQVTGRSSATVRVWERGSGETLACGSGACAVAVAGTVAGWFDVGVPVDIRMPGGVLRVVWIPETSVTLEGPAAVSFDGWISEDSPPG